MMAAIDIRWIVIGCLVLLAFFLVLLELWDRRRREWSLLISLNAMRLSHGPVETGELAGRYGMKPKRARRILDDLFSEGWVVGHADEELVMYWQITEAGVERLKGRYPELRRFDA